MTRFSDMVAALEELEFVVSETSKTHCIVRSWGCLVTIQPYADVKRFPNRIMATMGVNHAD